MERRAITTTGPSKNSPAPFAKRRGCGSEATAGDARSFSTPPSEGAGGGKPRRGRSRTAQGGAAKEAKRPSQRDGLTHQRLLIQTPNSSYNVFLQLKPLQLWIHPLSRWAGEGQGEGNRGGQTGGAPETTNNATQRNPSSSTTTKSPESPSNPKNPSSDKGARRTSLTNLKHPAYPIHPCQYF